MAELKKIKEELSTVKLASHGIPSKQFEGPPFVEWAILLSF